MVKDSLPMKFLQLRRVIGSALFLIICVMIALPHIYMATSVDSNGGRYAPAALDERWSRFDDIAKANASLNLSRNGTLAGKLGTFEDDPELYPNVLQESLVAVLIAPVVALTDNPDFALYVVPFFSGLAALMLFSLAVRMEIPVLHAALCAVITVLAYQYLQPGLIEAFFRRPDLIDVIIERRLESYFEYNSFYRFNTFGGSYFVFLAALLLYTEFGRRAAEAEPANLKIVVVTGAITGLLFYSYFFYSLAMPFIGATTLIWILVKIRDQDSSLLVSPWLRGFALAAGIAFLLALPSILNTAGLVFGDSAQEWRMRLQGQLPSRVIANPVHFMFFAIWLLVVFRRNAVVAPLIGLVLAVITVENLHSFTDISFQPGHMLSRVALPVLTLALLASVVKILLRIEARRIGYFASMALLIVASTLAVSGAVTWSKAYASQNSALQRLDPGELELLEEIRKLPADSVIAAIFPNIKERIAVYAGSKLYLPFGGHLPAHASNEFIHDRLSRLLWLSGAEAADMELFVTSGAPKVRYERYPYYYYQRYYEPRGRVPVSLLAETLAERLDHLDRNYGKTGLPLAGEWPDYLVTGGKGEIMRSFGDPPLGVVELIGEFEPYRLYRVIDSNVDPEQR